APPTTRGSTSPTSRSSISTAASTVEIAWADRSAPEPAAVVDDGQIREIQAGVVAGAVAHRQAAQIEARHALQGVAQLLRGGTGPRPAQPFGEHLGRRI